MVSDTTKKPLLRLFCCGSVLQHLYQIIQVIDV